MSDLLELTGRAEATHFWFRGFRAVVVPAIADIVGDRTDLRMLDCGCGTGYNLKHLLQPHGRAFGFDLHNDAIRRARSHQRPLVRADIERIPFLADTFDLATSFDVLQSVPDDYKALKEIARVLKPGGHVVLNVTAMDILRGDHGDVWGEHRRYMPDRAGRLVKSAGLEVVRISFLFASLVPLMLAVRRVQLLMRRFRAPVGDIDLTVPPMPINALLSSVVKAEAALSRRIPMPFGSSLLIVARKP
jgi:SAM-dependent methyltransferase